MISYQMVSIYVVAFLLVGALSAGTYGKQRSISCSWPGHCAGARCSIDDDCDGSLTCVNGTCGGGGGGGNDTCTPCGYLPGHE